MSAFAREARAAEEQPGEGGHDDAMQARRLDDLWDQLVALTEQAVDELEDEDELDVGRLRQLVGLVRSLAKQPGATPERRAAAERNTSALLTRLAVAQEGAPEGDGNNGNNAA